CATQSSSYYTLLDSEMSTYKNRGGAIWMGHSLGSVVCAWMCNQAPHWVSSVVLVDPVVFRLWEFPVAFNFLYRIPKTSLELLMYYFVSQELHIAHSLRRHFWWYENVLFPEQLPSPIKTPATSTQQTIDTTRPTTTVFLSTKDQIIDSTSVKQHVEDAVNSNLAAGSLRLFVWEGFTHGQFLVVPKEWRWVLEGAGLVE
ncbi:hypothetical protein HDU76_010555, partial [Blyttiomyces sp. JEL0837]